MMGAVQSTFRVSLGAALQQAALCRFLFFARERYRNKEPLRCKSLQIVADSDARECGAAPAGNKAPAFTIG
jgi:hypothetical protein